MANKKETIFGSGDIFDKDIAGIDATSWSDALYKSVGAEQSSSPNYAKALSSALNSAVSSVQAANRMALSQLDQIEKQKDAREKEALKQLEKKEKDAEKLKKDRAKVTSLEDVKALGEDWLNELPAFSRDLMGVPPEAPHSILLEKYKTDYTGAIAKTIKEIYPNLDELDLVQIVDDLNTKAGTKPKDKLDASSIGDTGRHLGAAGANVAGMINNMVGAAGAAASGFVNSFPGVDESQEDLQTRQQNARDKILEFSQGGAKYWSDEAEKILSGTSEYDQNRMLEKAWLNKLDAEKNPDRGSLRTIVDEGINAAKHSSIPEVAGQLAYMAPSAIAALLSGGLSAFGQALVAAGVGTVMTMEDAAQGAGLQIMEMSFDDIEKINPDLAAHAIQISEGDTEKAKRLIVNDVQNSARGYALTPAVLSSVLPMGASQTIRKALGSGTAKVTQGLSAKEIAKGASKIAGTAVIEGAEEGLTQLAENLAVKNVDPNTNLIENIGEGVALGAMSGGALGGASSIPSGARNIGKARAARKAKTKEQGTPRDTQEDETSSTVEDLDEVLEGAKTEETRAAPAPEGTEYSFPHVLDDGTEVEVSVVKRDGEWGYKDLEGIKIPLADAFIEVQNSELRVNPKAEEAKGTEETTPPTETIDTSSIEETLSDPKAEATESSEVEEVIQPSKENTKSDADYFKDPEFQRAEVAGAAIAVVERLGVKEGITSDFKARSFIGDIDFTPDGSVLITDPLGTGVDRIFRNKKGKWEVKTEKTVKGVRIGGDSSSTASRKTAQTLAAELNSNRGKDRRKELLEFSRGIDAGLDYGSLQQPKGVAFLAKNPKRLNQKAEQVTPGVDFSDPKVLNNVESSVTDAKAIDALGKLVGKDIAESSFRELDTLEKQLPDLDNLNAEHLKGPNGVKALAITKNALVNPKVSVHVPSVMSSSSILKSKFPKLTRAINSMGMGVYVNPELGKVRGRDAPNRILENIASDKSVGANNQKVAQALLDIYKKAKIKLPSVKIEEKPLQKGTQGQYNAGTNEINISSFPGVTPVSSVLHEYMHALTVRGLDKLNQMINSSNPAIAREGRAVNALIQEVATQMRNNIATSSNAGLNNSNSAKWTYGLTSPAEFFAEMFTPEFLALAQQTKLDTASLSMPAQQGLDIITKRSRSKETSVLESIYDILNKVFSYLLSKINKNAGFSPEKNTKNLLTSLNSYIIDKNIEAVKEDIPTTQNTYESRMNEHLTDSDEGIFISRSPEFESMVYESKSGFEAEMEDIINGKDSPPSSPDQELKRAIKNKDKEGLMKRVYALGRNINEMFCDNYSPVWDWVNKAVYNYGLPESEKIKLQNALYTGVGKESNLLDTAYEKFVNPLKKDLVNIQTKYMPNNAPETAIRNVGMWLTANRISSANALLLTRATEDIVNLRKAIEEVGADKNKVKGLTLELSIKSKELVKLTAAVYDPNVDAKYSMYQDEDGGWRKPDVLVAGGMSNAQAATMKGAIEKIIPLAEIKKVEQNIRKINAYKLAVDIESGRVLAKDVAKFLRKPGLEPTLKYLRDSAESFSKGEGVTASEMEELRNKVMGLIESEYVPLTGDPKAAKEMKVILEGGNGLYNISDDFKMMGRGTLASDGITTTFEALHKAVRYASYIDFQDQVANIYEMLTPEAREALGFSRTVLSEKSAGKANHAGIVVRKPGKDALEYRIDNRRVMDALRRTNISYAAGLFGGMKSLTSKFAYTITQLNPVFSIKQVYMDAWERLDILYGKDVYDKSGNLVDTKSVTQGVWAALLNPISATSIVSQMANANFKDNSKSSKLIEDYKELKAFGGTSYRMNLFTSNQASFVKEMDKGKFKTAMDVVSNVVARYNKTFESIPAVLIYSELKKLNIAPKEAAGITLDLMNFNKKGTKADWVSSLFAFSQPAFTGGANIVSTHIRSGAPKGRRWKVRSAVRLAQMTIGFTIVKGILGMAFGGDDEGGDIQGQQSEFNRNARFFIPIPGTDLTFKYPLGYGNARIANGVSNAWLDVYRGEKSPSEALGSLVGNVIVPGFSPIDASNINWSKRPAEAFMASITPTVLIPAMEVAINRNAWDAPILWNMGENKDLFKSDQFGKNVAPFYIAVAKGIRQSTGIDFAPEQVKHLIKGYGQGAIAIALNEAVDKPYARERGWQEKPSFFPIALAADPAAINGQLYRLVEQVSDFKKELNANKDAFKPGSTEMKQIKIADTWEKETKTLNGKQRAALKNITDQARVNKIRDHYQEKKKRLNAFFLYKLRTERGLASQQTDLSKGR